MRYYLCLIFALFFILIPEGAAMRPAPFEDISFKDLNTDYSLKSNVKKKMTQVFDNHNKLLWEYKEFIGRRIIYLSPDGKKLVLFGSYYFGSILRTDNSVEILKIIDNGKFTKNVLFDQIFGMSIEKAVKKFDLPKIGGGWVGSSDLIILQKIDWEKKNEAVFKLKDGTLHTVKI